MEAKNSDYVLNVMTRFDDPAAVWANAANTTKTSTTATIDLKDINVVAALADVNALLCQLNPEGGDPFNVTSVVLRKESGVSAVSADDDSKAVDVINLQGMVIRHNVSVADALQGMPAGVYIVGGQKYIVR